MKKEILIIVLLFLLTLCTGVYAIGISPSSHVFQYVPDKEESINFTVFNWGSAPTRVKVYYEGELAPYVTSPNMTVVIQGDANIKVPITFAIPKDIEFAGPKRFRVMFEEFSVGETGQMSAVTGMIAIVRVDIPYPGRFPEMSFTIPDTREGYRTTASGSITNKGEKTIENGHIDLQVSDLEGVQLWSTSISNVRLANGESKSFSEKIDTSTWAPGKYEGELTFKYHGETRQKKTVFHVGSLNIHITDYTKKLEQGKINKFVVNVENGWNEPMPEVYGIVKVGDQSTKTPTIGLAGFGNGALEGFIDTAGFSLGELEGKITVHFGAEEPEIQDITVTIVEQTEEPEEIKAVTDVNIMLYVAIAGGILLLVIIILVVDVVWLSTRINKKVPKKKGKK